MTDAETVTTSTLAWAALDQKPDLGDRHGVRFHRGLTDAKARSDRFRHEMDAVEQQHVGRLAPRGCAVTLHERIPSAADTPVLHKNPRIALWYYREPMPETMKDRLIKVRRTRSILSIAS